MKAWLKPDFPIQMPGSGAIAASKCDETRGTEAMSAWQGGQGFSTAHGCAPQPYSVWQVFNGDWFQLYSDGQWYPVAHGPMASLPRPDMKTTSRQRIHSELMPEQSPGSANNVSPPLISAGGEAVPHPSASDILQHSLKLRQDGDSTPEERGQMMYDSRYLSTSDSLQHSPRPHEDGRSKPEEHGQVMYASRYHSPIATNRHRSTSPSYTYSSTRSGSRSQYTPPRVQRNTGGYRPGSPSSDVGYHRRDTIGGYRGGDTSGAYRGADISGGYTGPDTSGRYSPRYNHDYGHIDRHNSYGFSDSRGNSPFRVSSPYRQQARDVAKPYTALEQPAAAAWTSDSNRGQLLNTGLMMGPVQTIVKNEDLGVAGAAMHGSSSQVGPTDSTMAWSTQAATSSELLSASIAAGVALQARIKRSQIKELANLDHLELPSQSR
eukprot:gene32452-31066_t